MENPPWYNIIFGIFLKFAYSYGKSSTYADLPSNGSFSMATLSNQKARFSTQMHADMTVKPYDTWKHLYINIAPPSKPFIPLSCWWALSIWNWSKHVEFLTRLGGLLIFCYMLKLGWFKWETVVNFTNSPKESAKSMIIKVDGKSI